MQFMGSRELIDKLWQGYGMDRDETDDLLSDAYVHGVSRIPGTLKVVRFVPGHGYAIDHTCPAHNREVKRSLTTYPAITESGRIIW